MADDKDRHTDMCQQLITAQLDELATACRSLPIPVGLATTPAAEAVWSVWRAAELAGQQPMPPRQVRLLYDACVLWVAAQDMCQALRADYTPWRLSAALGVLGESRAALSGLVTWLSAQR